MDSVRLGTWSGAEENNKIWFSNAFFNAICYYDIINKKIEICGTFPNIEVNTTDLHYDTYIVGDEVIFSPFYDNSIRIYNKYDKEFFSIQIPNKYRAPFSRSCKVENKIYFSTKNGKILFYDIGKRYLSEDSGLSDKYRNYMDKFGKGITIGTDKDGFTLLKWESTIVGRVNIKEHDMKLCYLPDYIEKFEIIKFENEDCWIFLKNSPDILRYRENDNKYLVVKGKEQWGKEKFKTIRYNKIKEIDNNIYLSNYNSGNILRIDKNNNISFVIAKNQEDYTVINKSLWGPIYTDILNIKEKIYFLPHDSDSMICYNCITEKIEKINFSINRRECAVLDNLLKQMIDTNIVYEDGGCGITLQDFIGYI